MKSILYDVSLKVIGATLLFPSLVFGGIIAPGAYPGELHISPGGHPICVCPRNDDDCKCVILGLLADSWVREGEDFVYYPARVMTDQLNGSQIYITDPSGLDTFAFYKSAEPGHTIDGSKTPPINLPGKAGYGPGGLVTCTCPMINWTCRCIWDPAGMNAAYSTEDDEFVYYRAAIIADPITSTPTFSPDPSGNALIALPKE